MIAASLLAYLALFQSMPGPSATLTEPMARIQGVDSPAVKVMIRTVDDGEILWVGQYRLGTTTEVMPGTHKFNVMCEFRASWGSRLTPADVIVEVEAGETYWLNARQEGERCVVTVDRPR